MRSAVVWIIATVYAGVCQREPCTKVTLNLVWALQTTHFCISGRSTFGDRLLWVLSDHPLPYMSHVTWPSTFVPLKSLTPSDRLLWPKTVYFRLFWLNFLVLSCGDPWSGLLLGFEAKMLDADTRWRMLWFIWFSQWRFDAVRKSEINQTQFWMPSWIWWIRNR